MKTNPTRLKYQEEPLSGNVPGNVFINRERSRYTNSVQDTEEFYKLLTDEQIEFLSSGMLLQHPHYVPGYFYKISSNNVSGEYMWLSDGDLIIKTGSTYYSHSINSIKTYIREAKINNILR
jgi:hypothetical protein